MKELTIECLENINASGWEETRDIIDGACIIGSFLNPYVALGCGVYGAGRWLGYY